MAYGTEAGLIAHATARGTDLSALDAAAIAGLLAQGSTYVDAVSFDFGDDKIGVPVTRFSGTPDSLDAQWPRTGAVDIYGNAIPGGAVPSQVEKATYEAALHEFSNAGSLNNTFSPNGIVKSEQVDVLRQEFFDPRSSTGSITVSSSLPMIPSVMACLAPLMSGPSVDGLIGNPYGFGGVVV